MIFDTGPVGTAPSLSSATPRPSADPGSRPRPRIESFDLDDSQQHGLLLHNNRSTEGHHRRRRVSNPVSQACNTYNNHYFFILLYNKVSTIQPPPLLPSISNIPPLPPHIPSSYHLKHIPIHLRFPPNPYPSITFRKSRLKLLPPIHNCPF